jgi:hypothetical protein
LNQQAMPTQLQTSLESVFPTSSCTSPSPRGRIAKYFTFAKRNLILEAKLLKEYALEAIEE